MGRPVDRRFGGGIGSSTVRDDPLLYSGVVVNGVKSKVHDNDVWQPVARIRCAGCEVVALLAVIMSNGRPRMLVAEVQVVTDWSARPVTATTARTEVTGGADVVADCPAHGAVEIAGSECISAAQVGLVRVAEGSGLTHIIDVEPRGERLEMEDPDVMSLEEAAEWLGWDTPG